MAGSNSRSFPGPCSICHRQYKDILDHLRSRHPGTRFTPQQIDGTGLLLCPCGAVALNDLGIRQHRAKSKCTSTLPSLVPLARLPSPLTPSTSKCPLCTSSPLSLLQHLQSAHRDHTWTSIELQPWGLAACTCGAAVLNRAALPGHRLRSKCSAWQDFQDRIQASITPFTNTANRTSSSPTLLINTPIRSNPTQTSSSPTRTSSHRSSSTQPSSNQNQIGIPHTPSINTHTRLTTRLSSSTTPSIVPHHSGTPPSPQYHTDGSSTRSDTPCNNSLDSLSSSPSSDSTTTPLTSTVDSSWQPGTHLRTDISISGSQANGTGPQEFDITIVSLASSQFRSTDPNKNTPQQVLSRAAHAKSTKYAARTASKFVPLVFSLGGAMETQCSSTLQSWKDHMPFGTHSYLLRRISILLLRARFRFFEG